MKTLKLMVGAVVMALLALILQMPVQASSRTLAILPNETETVKYFVLTEPTADIVSPEMSVRQNNYSAITNQPDRVPKDFTEAIALYFQAIDYRKPVERRSGKYEVWSNFF
jgi:hypothetical protein